MYVNNLLQLSHTVSSCALAKKVEEELLMKLQEEKMEDDHPRSKEHSDKDVAEVEEVIDQPPKKVIIYHPIK